MAETSPTLEKQRKISLDVYSVISESVSAIARDFLEYVKLRTGSDISPSPITPSESLTPTPQVDVKVTTKEKKEKTKSILGKILEMFSLGNITKVLMGLALVGGIVALMWDNFKESFTSFFSNLWEKMKEKFEDIKQWFGDLFAKGGELIGNLWNSVTDFFKPIMDSISNLAASVSNWFGEKFNELKSWITGVKIPAASAKEGMLESDVQFKDPRSDAEIKREKERRAIEGLRGKMSDKEYEEFLRKKSEKEADKLKAKQKENETEKKWWQIWKDEVVTPESKVQYTQEQLSIGADMSAKTKPTPYSEPSGGGYEPTLQQKEEEKTTTPTVLTLGDAISSAASMTGVSAETLRIFAQLESSFGKFVESKTSSAKGPFQFINSTWKEVMKRHGKKYGIDVANMPDKELLNLRFDNRIASLMAAEFIIENAKILKIDPADPANADELYLAHFLGPGGARSVLSGKGLTDKQKAAIVKANPNLKTASNEELLSFASSKTSKAGELLAKQSNEIAIEKRTLAKASTPTVINAPTTTNTTVVNKEVTIQKERQNSGQLIGRMA